MKILPVFIALLVLHISALGQAKKYPSIVDTLPNVTVDSVLISGKKGLNPQEFIDIMVNDTLFYEAFRNMQGFDFTAENKINTFDKKYKRTAKIYRKIKHYNGPSGYTQTILAQNDSGEVYKRSGDYDLYTVKMFSYIFMNDKNTDFINENLKKGQKDEEGYKQKLKTLIFNPGRPVSGVPLVGDRTQIFDKKYSKNYDFQYQYATLNGTKPIFRLKCNLKPSISSAQKDNMVIKEMNTIFDAYTLNIIGRYIVMEYDSWAFSFNIKMNIDLTTAGGVNLPAHIQYSGWWDVPLHQKEICSFDIYHYNYTPKK